MSLIIKKCNGYELEKEKKNTSEDFFNRSEVTFVDEGVEKTLHVLYVRFFDEISTEYTPFTENPIYSVGDKQYYFKDIVALICLLKNPTLRKRKRVYINDQDEFASYFSNLNKDKLFGILQALAEKGSYQVNPSFQLTM